MEFSFLVDVNLPKYFHYFKAKNFFHVIDINPGLTDQQIWDYAMKHNMVILTKDTDFYNRFISSVNSPKVVYFQLGNQTLQEMHLLFQNNWENIVHSLKSATFIIVRKLEIVIIK